MPGILPAGERGPEGAVDHGTPSKARRSGFTRIFGYHGRIAPTSVGDSLLKQLEFILGIK
jgi:hypothetical protein